MTCHYSQNDSTCKIHSVTAGRLALRGFSLALTLGCAASASGWTTLTLPDLISAPPHYGALAITHLADGRFLYGNNNQLYTQNTFGAGKVTPFAAIGGAGVDPSFLVVLRGNLAVVGAGMFGVSNVYEFNPQFPETPGYTSVTEMQNFSGVMQGSTGLYDVGANGSGGSNAVSYLRLNGKSQLLIDQVSTFSAGIARDAAGDLFIGDNDNNSVYEFTAKQLQKAIAANTTLTLGNGTLVHAFAADVLASLAVDAQGRLWATGFGDDGLFWWDAKTNLGGVLTPQASGGAYTVSTFTRSGQAYFSYVWQAGFDPGDRVMYGYATAAAVLAPVIAQQPSPVTTARGTTAQFTVTASSPSALPQTYAWTKNGATLRNGAKISGATTATLTISNIMMSDTGLYRAVITNPEGKTTSIPVRLTVQ